MRRVITIIGLIALTTLSLAGPFTKAVKNNDIKKVKFLLENGGDINELENAKNALCFAVANNNLEMIKLLVERKIDFYDTDTIDTNPYSIAALAGNYEAIKLFDTSNMVIKKTYKEVLSGVLNGYNINKKKSDSYYSILRILVKRADSIGDLLNDSGTAGDMKTFLLKFKVKAGDNSLTRSILLKAGEEWKDKVREISVGIVEDNKTFVYTISMGNFNRYKMKEITEEEFFNSIYIVQI